MKRRDFAMGLGGLALAGCSDRDFTGGKVVEVHAPSLPGPPVAPSAWPAGPVTGDLRVLEAAWADAMARRPAPLGRTDGLVIIQGGKLAFERYGADHGPTTRHISWSMAKSFTHALVGIAKQEGKVDPDRPLTLVRNADPKLTLNRLLDLTDGLAWDEAAYSVVDSDATRMLFGPGRMDGAAYTVAKGVAHPPGTHWRYSTGSFQLAAAELHARMFPAAESDPGARRAMMAEWVSSRLFRPLGMATALAEFDPRGGLYGGSLIYASARDYARFGELYRLDGVWNGKRILPEGWVKTARTPTLQPAYGSGFWLEPKAGNKPEGLMNGAGPMDAFSAEGHDGQVILIVPSKDVVVVRLGLSPAEGSWRAIGQWLVKILAALPDVKT